MAVMSNDNITFPVRIRVNKNTLWEFGDSEQPLYEDHQMCVQLAYGDFPLPPKDDGKPIPVHQCVHSETEKDCCVLVYLIAQRHKTVLEMRDQREVDHTYWALCSGTFQLNHLRAAQNLAMKLRPYVTTKLAQSMFPDGF
jgi:hypothetical protein